MTIEFDNDYIVNEIVKQVQQENISPEVARKTNNWIIRGTDKEGKFKVYDGPIPEGLIEEALKKAENK